MNQILLVDDDEIFLAFAKSILRKNGYTCAVAKSGEEGLRVAEEIIPDLILLDVNLPDEDGFDVFRKLSESTLLKRAPVIFVTGSDDQDTIYRCYDVGAEDYIGKPIRNYEFLAKVKLHLKVGRQSRVIREIHSEVLSLRQSLLSMELKHPEAFAGIITADTGMKAVFRYIEAIAPSSRPVLIGGESGVGKEKIARVIHNVSGRSGPFVAVNVGGLDDQLFSDTLFGHLKGAFTGAINARDGLIEKADSGTLFLDEVGDLRPESQIKLLRLLQENEYYPLGADTPRYTATRVLAATNQSLPNLISNGQFRDDLYYRLKTHQIEIPPLRDRKEDIPLLLKHFIKSSAKELKIKPPTYRNNLIRKLLRYDFPGNVREFESIIFDAVSRTAGDTLSVATIQHAIPESPPLKSDVNEQEPVSLGEEFVYSGRFPTLKEMNDLLLQKAWQRAGGNQSEAARLLGISRQAMNKRLKSAKHE